MSLDADTIVDRRRMRRKLTFWRVSAVLIAALAVVGAALAYLPGRISTPGDYIARIKIVTTKPDKAVAEVVPGFQKKKIEKEDRVQTRFN